MNMCRLFGFRSEKPVKPSHCLMNSKNSMLNQSRKNQDGWGISYFTKDKIEVIKSTYSAHEDKIFSNTSTKIRSNTILTHIRKATQGKLEINNNQPFKYNDWVFAHNGNLKNFPDLKEYLISKIDKELQENIIGNTDSEIIFYLLLSKIKKFSRENIRNSLQSFIEAIRTAIDEIEACSGKIYHDENGSSNETYLSFILTNGSLMLAHQGGKSMHYSQHNSLNEKTCLCDFDNNSVALAKHVIFSSEPLDHNTWTKMSLYEIAVVDYDFNTHLFRS